jgi:hypothetical protein
MRLASLSPINLFLAGVPGEFAAEAEREIREVAGDHRSVLAFDVGDRLLAGLDAIEEIAHVSAGSSLPLSIGSMEDRHPASTITTIAVPSRSALN